MPEEVKMDAEFFERADAVIRLANEQCQSVKSGKVSASCMYGVARFGAWLSACGCSSGQHMREIKEQAVEYFVKQYRGMLEDNLDDYIENFEKYMTHTDRGLGKSC